MADTWDNMERDEEGNYLSPGFSGLFFGKSKYTPAEVEEFRRRERERADRVASFTLTRQAFAEARPCVKCGQALDAKGRPARVHYTRKVEESGGGEECGTGEALLRTCRRCGFAWAERTVDAEA